MKKIFTFVLLCAAMMMGTAKAETVEIKANFGYAQYYDESADWFLVLYDENGNVVALDFFSEDYTSVVGEYSGEDFYLDYTFAVIDGMEYEVTSAEAALTRKDNITTIAATLVATDGNTYKVTYSDQFYGVEEDTYENEKTYFELAYDEEAEMTVLYIDAMDEEGETGNEIIIYLPGMSAEAETVNTGVYPINNSGKAGTAMAEFTGVDAYSWSEEDADYMLDVYYSLVSGTVTISEEEGVNVVVVEGVDYVGSSIYLSFTGDLSEIIASETGIKSAAVKAKAEKSVRNGQLIIKRQNVEYNALGAIVK